MLPPPLIKKEFRISTIPKYPPPPINRSATITRYYVQTFSLTIIVAESFSIKFDPPTNRYIRAVIWTDRLQITPTVVISLGEVLAETVYFSTDGIRLYRV